MDRENLRPVLDVSHLPRVAFGARNVSWLGNVLYMTIEGAMFAMIIASYFFLRTRTTEWPPGNHVPPRLVFGLISAAIFLLSLIPARWIKARAFEMNQGKVALGLVILGSVGLIAIIIRVFEFATLNCRWSDNAYASCLWILLGLHSGHLITEWLETLTVAAISFTPRMEGMRFADVGMNSDYWYFVVATAIATDIIIYGTPRWF
jgi:cytochrome c oxidase subunit III